ncbi:hypothetical protein [Dehalobacter sp. TeCB1]|uniref:phage tail assembly chaperone n=1 Tax=Dehalobacter sp. TeCB1 TaxID=1843715 RepID=UPI00083B084A|nr:hypothetical protein [Dehalobacter sp. TeCB1]OCZ53792.1 hypothetical protein A7D23_07470 [Dehalobacter sp. TeCB1]
MKNKPAKVTVSDLIKNADSIRQEKKQCKTKDLYVKGLDGVVTISQPTDEIIEDALELPGKEGDRYLLYNCIVEPNLKDKELQAAFQCKDPLEIIQALFTQSEIRALSLAALDLAGYGDGRVEEIKNS